jgi:hypothetical protein
MPFGCLSGDAASVPAVDAAPSRSAVEDDGG